MIASYRDLAVWQRAMELAAPVYELTARACMAEVQMSQYAHGTPKTGRRRDHHWNQQNEQNDGVHKRTYGPCQWLEDGFQRGSSRIQVFN